MGIKPFDVKDAMEITQKNFADGGMVCSDKSLQILLRLIGSHPGILKAAVRAVVNGCVVNLEEETEVHIIGKLLLDRAIVNMCENLWSSLSEIEKYCLKKIQNGMVATNLAVEKYSVTEVNEALKELVLKGIVIEEKHHSDKVYRCFSSLLVSYIAQQIPVLGLQLDISRQQVWIDGTRRANHLTPKEFQLLRFLAEHAGEVCSREETTRAVYGEVHDPRSDDARLDALVERVRKSIGDDSRPPRFLETVRGAGHRLKEYLGEPF